MSVHDPPELAIPTFMLLFGIALVLVGRYLAAGERPMLTSFVIDTLKASQSP